MPTVSPALLKNIKYSLGNNLAVIKSLIPRAGAGDANSGVKLVFNLTTGKFSTEKNALIRTMGNLFKSGGSDSATNKNCFEYPLLITFYELRKLQLNIRAGKTARNNSDKDIDLSNPLGLYQQGSKSKTDKVAYAERLADPRQGQYSKQGNAYEGLRDGLLFLMNTTYQAQNKRPQRDAITAILTKASQLNKAETQPKLDNLLAGWIPFVIPEDIKNMVTNALFLLQNRNTFISLPNIDYLNNRQKDFRETRIGILSAYIYEYVYYALSLSGNTKVAKPFFRQPAAHRKDKKIYGIDTSIKLVRSNDDRSVGFKGIVAVATGPIIRSHVTVRCGLIAKGLINSAENFGSNLFLITQDTCIKNLAFVFSQAGEKFMKPFNTGFNPLND